MNYIPAQSVRTGAMLFSRYQNNQGFIGQRVNVAIAALWNRMVDPYHFSDSWRGLEPIVSGIIDTHYAISAADAAGYYSMSRAVAGFYGGQVPGTPLSPQQLRIVTNSMGIGQFFHFLNGG